MNTTSTPITIIGGGIVGLCTALSLAESGHAVRIIDRDPEGQAASYGNAGVISPWSIVPQAKPGQWRKIPAWVLRADGPVSIRPAYAARLIPWAWRFLRRGNRDTMLQTSRSMHLLTAYSIDLYRQILAGTGSEYLLRDSYYVHAFRDASAAQLEGFEYTLRAQYGAPLERIDAQELRQLEPALSTDYTAAILIKDQARAMSPGQIRSVIAEKLQRLGAEFITAHVHSVSSGNSAGRTWCVGTSSGEYLTDSLVIAAGAWSAKLLAPLGIKLPLEAERGYHLQFPDPQIELNHSIMDTDHAVVASSMADGVRAAGTAEFAGLDQPPNPQRIESLARVSRKMMPDLNTKGQAEWMGHRPSFPDSLPAIGEFAGHPGLYAAFGHCHYGLMMAPKTGQLISSLINNVPLNEDLSAFSPDRF